MTVIWISLSLLPSPSVSAPILIVNFFKLRNRNIHVNNSKYLSLKYECTVHKNITKRVHWRINSNKGVVSVGIWSKMIAFRNPSKCRKVSKTGELSNELHGCRIKAQCPQEYNCIASQKELFYAEGNRIRNLL